MAIDLCGDRRASELLNLVNRASELTFGAERLSAVAQLRNRRLGHMEAHLLCDCLKPTVHPAERAAGAQVLGYHDAALRYPEVKAAVMRWADRENDPRALRAMVFALRNTDGVVGFLLHRDARVAIEAVMGLPGDTGAHRSLLSALFACEESRAVEAMCRRIAGWDAVAPEVVAFLMTANGPKGVFEDRVKKLFAPLPQLPLMACLVDQSGEIQRTYNGIWPGIWRRERQRYLMDLFVQTVAVQGAEEPMVRGLAERVAADEAFFSGHVRFVRSLLGAFDAARRESLRDACATLAKGATREGLGRMAEMLIALVRLHPEAIGLVQALLGKWETLLPGVRLQAFHAAR